MGHRVFVDANILYSKTLMDWTFLFRLHNSGMFQLHSTEDVLAETLANMRKKNPTAPGALISRRAALIRKNLDEVISDFPGSLPFSGRDPEDYHVHAAAIWARADIVLTCNDPRDFTADEGKENYEILHPDAFFLLVSDSNPLCLAPIIREQISYWSQKPTRLQLDAALRSAGCPAFAERVRAALSEMARGPFSR